MSRFLSSGSIQVRLKRTWRSRKSCTVRYLSTTLASSGVSGAPRFLRSLAYRGSGLIMCSQFAWKKCWRMKTLSSSVRSSAGVAEMVLYLSRAAPEAYSPICSTRQGT